MGLHRSEDGTGRRTTASRRSHSTLAVSRAPQPGLLLLVSQPHCLGNRDDCAEPRRRHPERTWAVGGNPSPRARSQANCEIAGPCTVFARSPVGFIGVREWAVIDLPVVAVDQGVNELESRTFPSFPRRGGRDQLGAAGVVVTREQTTPAAPARNGAISWRRAAAPPWKGGVCPRFQLIHTCNENTALVNLCPISVTISRRGYTRTDSYTTPPPAAGARRGYGFIHLGRACGSADCRFRTGPWSRSPTARRRRSPDFNAGRVCLLARVCRPLYCSGSNASYWGQPNSSFSASDSSRRSRSDRTRVAGNGGRRGTDLCGYRRFMGWFVQ